MNILKLNRGLKITSKFAGLLLIICAVFRQYRVSSFIALCFFALYILNSIIVEKDRLFLKYLPVTFSALFFLVGTFICDNVNVWLGEINKTTYYVGAFNLLAVYYWALFTFLGIFDKKASGATKRKHTEIKVGATSITQNIYKYSPRLVFVMGSLLFLLVMKTPIFGGEFVNRFEYAQQNIGKVVNALRVFPTIMIPLLIEPYINKKKTVSFSNICKSVIVPYIPYILFLIWTGNKYGAFIEIIYLAVIPIISFVSINKKVIKNLLKYTPIFLFGLIFLLVLYYYLAGNDFITTLQKIGIRIACQGELWWKSVALTDYHGVDMARINEELSFTLSSIKEEGISRNYGIYRLMKLLGAPAVVKLYMTQGTRFTAAGIELPFYSMGYLAFIIMPIIYAIIMTYFINVYANATREGRFVASVGSARLILVTLSAITQGDWYVYFSLIPMFFFGGLVLSQYISKKK